MVLPSCGEYKPISQVALLSSNPTKSVAISSWAAGASAEVDIPVSIKFMFGKSGTLTEPRLSPHRIWKKRRLVTAHVEIGPCGLGLRTASQRPLRILNARMAEWQRIRFRSYH